MFAVRDEHRVVGIGKIEVHKFLRALRKLERHAENFVNVGGDMSSAHREGFQVDEPFSPAYRDGSGQIARIHHDVSRIALLAFEHCDAFRPRCGDETYFLKARSLCRRFEEVRKTAFRQHIGNRR